MDGLTSSIFARWALVALCVTGCASQQTAPASAPAPALQTAVAAGSEAPASSTAAVAPSPPVGPADVYTVDVAMRDALSSPLEFVGHTAWPGLFQVLACVYRNQRVEVVDERCLPVTRGRATIHIYSPTEGYVALWGRSADGSSLLSMQPRRYESFGVGSYPVAPRGIEPRIRLGMSSGDMKAYLEAMVALGAARHRAGQPQEPRCWYSTDRGLECDRMDGATFSASAQPFIDDPPPEWRQLLQQILEARSVPRPLDTSSPERIAEQGAVYGRVHSCDALGGLETIGNTEGLFVPILLTGENELTMVCALRRGGRDVAQVVRVEGLRITHRKRFAAPRNNNCHAESLVEVTPAEYVMYSQCGTRADHAQGQMHPRLTRFSRDGTVRWVWVGGPGEYPSRRMQRRPDGSFYMEGHVNPADRRDAIRWQATVSAGGDLISRQAGGELPPLE